MIGNPPYVNAWSMTEADNQVRYSDGPVLAANGLSTGHWDLHCLSPSGVSSLWGTLPLLVYRPELVPTGKVCRTNPSAPAHPYLVGESNVLWGENVFEEVSRQTLIPVFQKIEPGVDWRTFITLIDSPPDASRPENPIPGSVSQARFYDRPERQSIWRITFGT